MANLIVTAVIAAILGFVIHYIYKEKKRGVNCIGCPDSGTCGGNCAGCNGTCGK